LIKTFLVNVKHQADISQSMSGTMPLGNIVLAGGIMFSGASLTTTLIVFRHAGIQMFQ
jgi:hypothetical protein